MTFFIDKRITLIKRKEYYLPFYEVNFRIEDNMILNKSKNEEEKPEDKENKKKKETDKYEVFLIHAFVGSDYQIFNF